MNKIGQNRLLANELLKLSHFSVRRLYCYLLHEEIWPAILCHGSSRTKHGSRYFRHHLTVIRVHLTRLGDFLNKTLRLWWVANVIPIDILVDVEFIHILLKSWQPRQFLTNSLPKFGQFGLRGPRICQGYAGFMVFFINLNLKNEKVYARFTGSTSRHNRPFFRTMRFFVRYIFGAVKTVAQFDLTWHFENTVTVVNSQHRHPLFTNIRNKYCNFSL